MKAGQTNQQNLRFVELERPYRLLLGYSVLVLAPLALLLLVMAGKFQGLSSPGGWDQAQIARHVAAGDGFATSLLRPLSLAIRPSIERHPDLSNAPGYPLLLAGVFSLGEPSDRAVAVTGLALWVISVWLTFLIAHRW